ncbi:MAG: FAD-binding domain-containing protein [Flavitalea sp.]
MFPTKSEDIQKKINAIDPEKYARTRNYLDGSVTYLSPYISRGVISTNQVLHSVLSNGYDKWKMEKFVQELAWREFFQRTWQQKGDKIFQDIKEPVREFKQSGIPIAISNATTGIHAVDRCINDLYENGYMHNHCRMYVASITCNIARTHWEHPAKWLYYHLFDGDLASNMLSWQWVAGTFSKKLYFCNQENINRYTRTSQQDTYLDKSYEEISEMKVPDTLLEVTEERFEIYLPSTPFPVIDENLPTLIYNSYNLDPIWHKGEKANRVLLLEPNHFSRFPISEKVLNFILNLAKEIEGIQLYCGRFEDLKMNDVIFKEHPLNGHYKGKAESRDWLFPEPDFELNSFFSFWKKSEKYWKRF